jgi:uncharacterized protein (TIGR01319 family)
MSVNSGDEATSRSLVRAFVLADFGSTFTKLTVVEAGTGRLIARSSRTTTVNDNVMVGYRTAKNDLVLAQGEVGDLETLACSSAGGGLRVVVIGLERDITAEAARRVALNSGGRIVGVLSGNLDEGAMATLCSSAADIALIVGGTDGGNPDALIERAQAVASALPQTAAVVAGNVESAGAAAEILNRAGVETIVVANVLPEIGMLVVAPARDAIRAQFIRHVIGGKNLSRESDFTAMVLMPTPDAVLGAVELLAAHLVTVAGSRPVIVIDVGGATTDVYSTSGDSNFSTDHGFVPVPTLPTRRTVEADLGLRWSAPGIVEAAVDLGLISPEDERRLRPEADRLSKEAWTIPMTDDDLALDAELSAIAVAIALFRHVGVQRLMLERDGLRVTRDGPDLRGHALLVLTGGVFRAQGSGCVETRTMALLNCLDRRSHLLPDSFDVVVDQDYVLAACGLLATRDLDAARNLLRSAFPVLSKTEGSSRD